MHRALPFAFVLLSSVATAQDPGWPGKWFTTRGVLTIDADGRALSGRYGDGHELTGKADGAKLAFDASEGNAKLSGALALDASGHRFTGTWRGPNGDGEWRGWREDPAAKKGRAAKLDGAWRTSWGLLEIEAKAKSLRGGFGAQGWSTFEGELEGRHAKLQYESPFGTGTIAFDVDADGKAAFGSVRNARGEWAWQAQRLDGYAASPQPKPGAIVAGLADNRLTYYLRAPKGWKKSDRAPLLVILHGSNMGAKPYVESAAASPIADRFMIVGIDGEQWQDWSKPDDPRHNYTYVNWMGRSTYEGYPNTHRESPALVAELLTALRKQLQPRKVFVGGHSQGGFLSWFFAMHTPELVDGIFPISCGLVIQCEPDVFDDSKLREAQRRVAIAVVHGERDPVVAFSAGESAYRSFCEQRFPWLRLFKNAAGHGFSALPWVAAVEWLEAATGDDPAALASWAQARIDAEAYRDASAAVLRLRELKGAPAATVKELAAKIDAYAEPGVTRFTPLIAEGEGGAWVDEFLDWRDQFELADCAREVIAAWDARRAEHLGPARQLYGEARKLFQQGQRDAGWKKYEELVAKYWASPLYRRVKGWLADRR